MKLPLRLSWDTAQDRWASILGPVISCVLSQGQQLSDIDLIVGANVINHKLGRKQIGWSLSDIDAPASIYRSQPLNDKTLTLTSDAVCTVSLWVF